MLPIVLVLFVATSALAAPSVSVNQVAVQQTARPYDTGFGFNSGLAAQLFELVDGGDTNIYILTLQQILQDLARQPNSYSQALAVSQVIAVLGTIAFGVPGNSCSAANAINQYAAGTGGQSYVATLASNIDAIAALASNPASIRYASGSSGNCNGGGRTYQFEAAWNGILDNTTPDNVGLVNEEYCAAKRLYQSFNVRSNNVGAAVTAASLPPVVKIVRSNIVPIINFLRQVANGNGYGAAASCKQALSSY